ncbi:MAG TPA: hypothetical protein EYQ82_12360 [Dehalococcoidia bacterium]|nr:hypothetical protein [Dehalococcoidia bacterium]
MESRAWPLQLFKRSPHVLKHLASPTGRGVASNVLLVVGILPYTRTGAGRETAAGLVAAVNDYLVRAKALTS